MSDPSPLRGPRIRRTPIPPEAMALLRGNQDDPDLARRQARHFRARFPDWGRFGVSAFYARNDSDIDDLLGNQLERFSTVFVLRIDDLSAAEFEVVPTFRTPHVTIAFASDVDRRLAMLDSLAVERLINPYHDRRWDTENDEEGPR